MKALLRCGICNKEFWTYPEMRTPNTVSGQLWCKDCQDEFDSINWEKVYEERNK